MVPNMQAPIARDCSCRIEQGPHDQALRRAFLRDGRSLGISKSPTERGAWVDYTKHKEALARVRKLRNPDSGTKDSG